MHSHQISISKCALNPSAYLRPTFSFLSARSAFAAVLGALELFGGRILLPAYIGWSPREGSGVFDPIKAQGLQYSFYALDRRLRIDLGSLRRAFEAADVRVLVIIHYFGYVDPCYADAVKLAREHDVFVIEDAAHAMLTDFVGNLCGNLGDACLYSFHKLLPVPSGGALRINDPASPIAERVRAESDKLNPACNFDLSAISARRRANALLLDTLMREAGPHIEPLLGAPEVGEIPQTYPVLISNDSRDQLYEMMNAAGFGVVSLYHTLISEIPQWHYPHTTYTSRHILNLPVHQDIQEGAIIAMCDELTKMAHRA